MKTSENLKEEDTKNFKNEIKTEQEAFELLNKNYQENKKLRHKDLDEDEIAEIVAIGKKMLWKKDRREIIDQAYNRYNYVDDDEDLPEWFVEDEKKHIGKHAVVTKEDVMREKEALKTIKARLPKKVLEAKMRKKKRAMLKLKKA